MLMNVNGMLMNVNECWWMLMNVNGMLMEC